MDLPACAAICRRRSQAYSLPPRAPRSPCSESGHRSTAPQAPERSACSAAQSASSRWAGPHDRAAHERDAGLRQRRCVRQVWRIEPSDHAIAIMARACERAREEGHLTDAHGVVQHFRERAHGPSAAGQLAVECRVPGCNHRARSSSISPPHQTPGNCASRAAFGSCMPSREEVADHAHRDALDGKRLTAQVEVVDWKSGFSAE